MKKWIVIATLALSGCAQLNNYSEAVKTPAPADLQGNWQTVGAQSALVSPEAIGSLYIGADGSTLDCRQWMRVIAKPGKLTRFDDQWVNVNRQVRVMPLVVENGELHYDGLTLRKVDRPTLECQQAQDMASKYPDLDQIQNVDVQILQPHTEASAPAAQ